MSELGSAVEELRAESLAELPDARVEEDFDELHRAIEQLDGERLRRLAEIDRRRLFERDGHLSSASWLVSRHRSSWGTARESVRVARGLERMPATRRALAEGDLSMSAVHVLVRARDADPEAFDRAEGRLVEAARIHSVKDLSRVAAFWREAAGAGTGSSAAEQTPLRGRLHASVTFQGMVRLDGDLDPETGENVLTALQAVLDAEARSHAQPDTRSPAERRADALGEVCRQWLDRRDRPQIGGERPHVTVTVDAGALIGGVGAGELDHAGPVPVVTARRLACDASLTRVVLSPRSEPLDVGRRTPVVSPAIRRAVIVRDRHCRFPGCDRPHTWCDAHHVVHWANGGPTSVANLLLLCRRHHRMVHDRGGFRLEMPDGRPVFRRSDGSLLEDRAPP